MLSVAKILQSKSDGAVYTIDASDTVFSAIQLMAEKQIGSLLVIEHGVIVGIVTERDYARKLALMNRVSRLTAVREIMSAHVLFVQPEQTSYECLGLVNEHHVRHLPVLEGDRLVGMISIGDLVKEIIADQRFTIEQLERYISN